MALRGIDINAIKYVTVINRLRGIVPTFTVFDVDPSSPANMTDGNWTTESGEGTKALGAPGDVGTIIFDMGAVYPVLVIAKMNIHRDSGDGTLSVVVGSSDDNITYFESGTLSISAITTDFYRPFDPMFSSRRYVRLRIAAAATSVASVYHVKVAEVMAIRLL